MKDSDDKTNYVNRFNGKPSFLYSFSITTEHFLYVLYHGYSK